MRWRPFSGSEWDHDSVRGGPPPWSEGGADLDRLFVASSVRVWHSRETLWTPAVTDLDGQRAEGGNESPQDVVGRALGWHPGKRAPQVG